MKKKKTWLPLDGFSWNLILENFIKISRDCPNFFKIGYKYRALYFSSALCSTLFTFLREKEKVNKQA